MQAARKNSLGFTLIELLIIVAIISILAVVTLPRWPGYNLNLGAQARQLANDIRYTQALSMNANQRYSLIRLSSTTYQIQNASGTAITLANGNTTAVLGAGISFGTFTNLPNSLISFSGAGIPWTSANSSGSVLASIATMPLTTGSFTQTVSIYPTTGRVLVS